MLKRLPVPIILSESVIVDRAEIKKPSARVLSNTRDALQKGAEYMAMKNFVAGCTVHLLSSEGQEIKDSVSIKGAYGKGSNKNIEYLSQEIMIFYYNGEDYVEGVYPCPRCQYKIISEKTMVEDIEIDTRDRISSLTVNFMDDPEKQFFSIKLSEPITIADAYDSEAVSTLDMHMPTVNDFIEAFASVGDDNPLKLQLEAYARAVDAVNGVSVDGEWRRSLGVQMFNICEEVQADIGRINNYINQYGVDPRVKKKCPECGKEWQPFINTYNFFGSALQ